MPKEKTSKKLSMDELIQKADQAKKRNPLDLSSDQDLSIAVMNLVSLEEHFFFSGGKTGETGFYDLINIVREMRKDMMDKLVNKNVAGEGGEVWCISKHLLAASMRLFEVGTKALGDGEQAEAYAMFGRAYDLYSLFWGINMGLIDLKGVQSDKSISPALKEWVAEKSNPANTDKSPSLAKGADGVVDKKSPSDSKSLLGGLGAWVKKSVNCCIE